MQSYAHIQKSYTRQKNNNLHVFYAIFPFIMHYFLLYSPISNKEHKKGTSYMLQKQKLFPMKNKTLQLSHTFPCPKTIKSRPLQSKCLIFRFNIYLKENTWSESRSYMTRIKYPMCHYWAALLRSQSWSFFPCCHSSADTSYNQQYHTQKNWV